MRRPALVLTLLVALLAPALARPSTALACSAGPDWDAVRESAVIIVGRVVDMRLAPEAGGAGQVPQSEAVWVDFEVDRYLKGSGPRELSALDRSSVVFFEDQTPEQKQRFEGATYHGSGGACGALNADPRGQYWVTGLSLRDGVYGTNLLLLFGAGAIGSGPDDPVIVARIAELEERVAALQSVPSPASTGHGVEGQRSTFPLELALAGITVVLLLGGRGVGRFR